MNDAFHDALQERVTERLHRHVDQSMRLLDQHSLALVDASGVITSALLSEGRILACGEGAGTLLAQYLAGTLLNRLALDRPGLPAIALGSDGASLSAIAVDHGLNDIFARPVRALGQPQDVLVLIAMDSGSGIALQTVQAAHDRGMPVIALCRDICDDFRALLTGDDLELELPTSRRDEFMELALPVIHCLCDLVEVQLFGTEE